MTETRFIERIVAWLNGELAPPGVTIDADTELFEDGLIDSMRILQIIAWTERETGRRVPDQQIRMDNFHTPQRIAATFARG